MKSQLEIKNIAKSAQASYTYAKEINFKNVPEIIINSIAQYNYLAYEYAQYLDFKNVPETIIESIASDGEYSYWYSVSLNFKNVPPIIMKSFIRTKKDYEFSRWINDEEITPDKMTLFLIARYDDRINL